jgi:hypothetical protein
MDCFVASLLAMTEVRHAGNSYPTALSTSIAFCTAGRAIIRA